MSFSDRTLRVLTSAGWNPERVVEIDKQVRALEKDGYTVADAVRRFLSSFGLLRLEYAHYQDPTRPDHAHFDAAKAAANIFPEKVTNWSEIVGEELCPIGEAFSDHMTLAMGGRGAVYGGYEGTIVRVGSTEEEAIEALCSGVGPQKISGSA